MVCRRSKRMCAWLLLMALVLACMPASATEKENAEQDTAVEMQAFSDTEADVEGNYTTWQNAPVLQSGQTASFALNTYNSAYAEDQVWFAIALDEGQAVRLAFTNITKRMHCRIFDGAALEGESSPTSANISKSYSNFSEDVTYSWKALHAGTYYIMLQPYSGSYTSTSSSYLTCTLLDGDLNENNDTWQTATELTQNVNVYYNLNGDSDVDWFKITTTTPGQAIKLTFSNFDYTVSHITAQVYSGADLEAGKSNNPLVTKENFGVDSTLSCKTSEPGDYYLKVKPYYSNEYVTKDLKLRFELLSGDANENNDTYSAATLLPGSTDVAYNLNGSNDMDWFYFETTKEEELVYFYFSGFETDYSNYISYAIYDATDSGYSNALESDNLNYNGTVSLTFANPGRHYIRIKLANSSTPPVENDLKLRLERGVSDDGEPNDTWQQATPLVEGAARVYTLPATSDNDYFTFTVTEPDQTVELLFENPSSGIRFTLYTAAALNASGSSASAFASSGTSAMATGTQVYRYMLGEPGTYYLRLYTNTAFDTDATVTYTLIPPDANERNNTWKTATVLTEGMTTSYTLPAKMDYDYFKFTTTEPDQTVKLKLYNPVSGLRCRIYSEADFEAEGDDAGYLFYTGTSAMSSGAQEIRYMLSNVGTYYIRMNTDVVFDETEATISYELLPPDGNERNNTWTTATTLTQGIAMPYTLPATNDSDFFKFTTTVPNQTVKFTFHTPVSGLRYYIYSGADFETEGNSTASLFYSGAVALDSGKKEARYTLGSEGDYYIKLYCDNPFDTEATLTFDLIPPDANEGTGNSGNNYWNLATPLSAQERLYFTLPSINDTDWFKLDPVTPGDQVTITLEHVDLNTQVIYALYYVAEGDDTATQVGYVRSSSTSLINTTSWTASVEGDYYFRVYISGNNVSSGLDKPLNLKYTITQNDIAVNGVSIQGGGVTIFEGKTIQLTAKVSPSNATNQAVTWSSDARGVATVDQHGKVTAVAPGSATITVQTAEGGYQATTQINVANAVAATGVTLTVPGNTEGNGTESDPKTLAFGTSIQLTATVSPDNATEQGVTWSVSGGEGVLSVNQYGLVYAAGSGKARVVATTVDGNHTAEYWFSVPDESHPVRNVSLSSNTATLYLGEGAFQLTAAVAPSYATNPGVTWESDNDAVATVDQNGRVTPVSTGYATITVTAVENSGISAECLISVQPARTRVEGISFASESMDVGLYASTALEPVFDPVDATDRTVTWESSNKAVATVSRTGVVTAIGLGSATITATSNDGGYQASITVKVSLTAGYGDVNNDGDVDAADALMILQASVGLRALTTNEKEIADVNGDGYVDAADAILILRYNAGLVDAFPVESK